MNILIAGGNSDIAQHLKDRLSENPLCTVFCVDKKELDVASEESIKYYLSKAPLIDCFINAAGTVHPVSILESDENLWLNDIKVNFLSNYLIAKRLLSVNKKVKLIFISSAAAFEVYKDWSSYCISKMATVNLTKHLAKEGIEAFCICPGGIDTKFRKKINIVNTNPLSIEDVTLLLMDIVFTNKYQRGDCILYKKNLFKVYSLEEN